MQQVTAVIDDGNTHRPMVFQGFSLSSGSDGLDVCQFENGFCLHVVFLVNSKNPSIRSFGGNWRGPRPVSQMKKPLKK
jgi:hypothetical protein